MASKRSAMVSGETRLFSKLTDLREEFWSITEHRVATAKSLICKENGVDKEVLAGRKIFLRL